MTQNDLDFLKKYLNNKVIFGLISEIDAQDICGMMILNCLEEPINEEELDRLAVEYIKSKKDPAIRVSAYNAYRAGYRKAKGE